MDFKTELEHVINKHCAENGSNTPDFILAQYMNACLIAFEEAVNTREKWYGRDPDSRRLNLAAPSVPATPVE